MSKDDTSKLDASGPTIGEAVERLKDLPRGKLANALAGRILGDIEAATDRIAAARKDIESGARTRRKDERFRL